MFSRYYQSELAYLRELGREFANANPALAKTFSDAHADPDVERLLEGFAFLTARIRERIDSALPEVIDTLGEMIVPQAFRTIPACSIVQFSPDPMAIRGRYLVTAGTELASREVAGTKCLFRTVAPVTLMPVQIERTSLDPSTESGPVIRIRMRVGAQVQWPDTKRIRFFLKGALGVSTTILLWLAKHLEGATVQTGGKEYELGGSVTFPGLSREVELLPWPETVPDGLRLMQEYFALAEKLLFVDVEGFDAVPEDAVAEQLDLVLRFRGAPPLPERLPEDAFQLYCVPVVNLFETDGQPVINDSKLEEHLVSPARMKVGHAEVYRVASLTGLERKGSEVRRYSPFFSFAHLGEAHSRQRYYTVQRVRSAIDDGIDTYISVLTPSDQPPDVTEETLSFDLVCTNRKLPAELRPGDISERTLKSPTVAGFRNITAVSRPTTAFIGPEKHWRLVSHLALNTRSLSDAGVLKALLDHYNPHEASDVQLYQANRLRIESIRAVEASHERRVFKRIPMFGLHTRVELEDAGFAGIGDAYVFGCALQRLFVSETPVNSFHRLTLNLHPSNQSFEWSPEIGSQELL